MATKPKKNPFTSDPKRMGEAAMRMAKPKAGAKGAEGSGNRVVKEDPMAPSKSKRPKKNPKLK
jgi:hypothetical protein